MRMERACRAPHFEELKLPRMRMEVRAAVDESRVAQRSTLMVRRPQGAVSNHEAGEREDDQGHIEA
jgi:hypothetical protein